MQYNDSASVRVFFCLCLPSAYSTSIPRTKSRGPSDQSSKTCAEQAITDENILKKPTLALYVHHVRSFLGICRQFLGIQIPLGRIPHQPAFRGNYPESVHSSQTLLKPEQ